jgi:DNA-binding CsgD family transcriptional regulator/tetratricopeptide (TPR) repeat protein
VTITVMDLWEREGALAGLEAELKRSAAGGRVALVAGEAGIGKSSVVAEFTHRAATTARVLWGACDQLVTPRAFGPLHDIGRTTGGVLAQRLAAAEPPEQVYTAFLDVLTDREQRHRPVVVVEDAHWADEATLDWLTFLGRRIAQVPALLVVTYRDDEVGPEHPLRRVLAALPRDVVARVPVEALSPDLVVAEARRAGHDPALVRKLAGGNPLLVTELLKDSSGAVPTAVQDLILERLRRLPPEARDLAHLVSVVPTRAEAAVVEHAGDAVDQCIAAGVLVPAGDGLAFRHEVLRSAVEDAMSPTRRASMHARVLALVEDDPGVDPGRLVHHARLAGDAAGVLAHGRVAGESAARQGAHREAAEHLAAAAAFADRLPDEDRADLLEQAGHACYLVGRYRESLDLWRAALQVREALGQSEETGNDLRWISRISWWAGNQDEARQAVSRAIEVLETLAPGASLAQAYGHQARLFMTAHQVDEAAEGARRALTLAERIGDQDTALQAAVTLAVADTVSGDPDGIARLEALHAEADALNFTDTAARAIINIAIMSPDELAEFGPEVTERFSRAERYMAAHDLDGYRAHLHGTRSHMLLERGDWAEALALADEVLASPLLLGMGAVLPLVTRGRILAARGEPDAESALDEAARYAEDVGDIPMKAPVAAALSELYLWDGREELARKVARDALAQTNASVANEFIVGRLAWRLWRSGGDDPVPDGAALPFRQMIQGDWAAAAEEWGRRGATYLRAEALSMGDESAAAEALRILDGLGATRAADFARAQLRARGMTRVPRGPRRSTTQNVAGLTQREAEVLALLAEGLSNAAISDRLTLSAKTVGHHVSAILGKLGVATRGQAVAEAHRLDLVP